MSKIRITLRPVEAADKWMLRALFAEYVRAQLRASALTPREIELLIEVQFRDGVAQSHSGEGDLEQSVVPIDGVAVGYLVLDRRPGETVITDQSTPRMSGLQLAQALRAVRPGLPPSGRLSAVRDPPQASLR